jgi:hypothetical protein
MKQNIINYIDNAFCFITYFIRYLLSYIIPYHKGTNLIIGLILSLFLYGVINPIMHDSIILFLNHME